MKTQTVLWALTQCQMLVLTQQYKVQLNSMPVQPPDTSLGFDASTTNFGCGVRLTTRQAHIHKSVQG